MTEFNPVFPWDKFRQILLNLVRVVLLRQPQPMRQSAHVRVHDDGGLAERVGDIRVRRLAPDAVKGQ